MSMCNFRVLWLSSAPPKLHTWHRHALALVICWVEWWSVPDWLPSTRMGPMTHKSMWRQMEQAITEIMVYIQQSVGLLVFTYLLCTSLSLCSGCELLSCTLLHSFIYIYTLHVRTVCRACIQIFKAFCSGVYNYFSGARQVYINTSPAPEKCV